MSQKYESYHLDTKNMAPKKHFYNTLPAAVVVLCHNIWSYNWYQNEISVLYLSINISKTLSLSPCQCSVSQEIWILPPCYKYEYISCIKYSWNIFYNRQTNVSINSCQSIFPTLWACHHANAPWAKNMNPMYRLVKDMNMSPVSNIHGIHFITDR